jgi:RNA polymerase sigma factor (sigma-70 family)
MTGTAADAELVAAARNGSQQALDELVGRYLPLVYNIVGRAMPGRAEVDDVVQETMLRVVRGLPQLRDERAFRSWLVAVAMNQIREHRQTRSAPPRALDELAAMPDPGADFADLTLTELGLSGQRRETVEATRWLDEDDRELLSLWWLVTAGHLTQAELVTAIGLDAHHVTVRVGRMRAQLDAARMVVRALSVALRCPELAGAIRLWDGRPSALWRKRLARHLRECGYCAGLGVDLIPAERLLVNFTLVPLPLGYAAYLFAGGLHGTAATTAGYATSATSVISATSVAPATAHGSAAPLTCGPVSHRRTRGAGGRGGRALGPLTGKPLLAAAAVTATIAAAVGVGSLALGPGESATTAQQQPGLAPADAASGAQQVSVATTAPTTASARPTTASPSPSAKPSLKPSAAPPTKARPTPAQTTRAAAQPAAQPALSSDAAAAQQVLAVINQARAQQGLSPLTISSGLESSSAAHNQRMAASCGLQHVCPGEASLGDRETAAGVHWMAAGENIGTGGPVANTTAAISDMAVGLTRSMLAEQPPNDGHRRNILSQDFHHIGIAVMRDSSGNVWLTQDFSD